MNERLKRWWPLALIVLIGAVFRLYRIGDLPPGLYRDEAYYGLDAARVLTGEHAIWFTANNGREPLFIYLLSVSVALFGQTVFALRLTAALVGIATVGAVYAAGRQMFSHRIGLLSAAVLAVTFWHVALSRVAYRAVTLPLLLCVTLALVFAALRTDALRRRAIVSTCAGLACGVTLYTYTSSIFVLPLMALYALSLVVGLRRELFRNRARDAWLRHRVSLLAFGAGAALAAAPLAIYVISHPDIYFARANQVSVFSAAINGGNLFAALLTNTGKALGMFLFEGDRIWRHNLSLRPVFDGFTGFAFAVGCVTCLWRWLRSWQSRLGSTILGVQHNVAPQFLVLWLLVFLTPTVLAEDTPHFLRAAGALPAACILCAVGFETALAWASRRGILSGLLFGALRRRISPPAFVAAILIALAGYDTGTDYFNDYVRRDATAYWLEAHNVALAQSVIASSASGPVWVQERLANDNPALIFLAGARFVSAESPGALPARGALFVDANHDWSAWRSAIPASSSIRTEAGPLAQGDRDATPRRAYIAAHFEPAQASGAPLAQFDNGIDLLTATGTGDPQMAGLWTVTLKWRASQALPGDYAVFVHYLRNGQLIAQHDGDPAQTYWPTSRWRPGDVIWDTYSLAINSAPKPGDEVRAGLYLRADNRRLNVRDAAGNPTGDYVIIPPS